MFSSVSRLGLLCLLIMPLTELFGGLLEGQQWTNTTFCKDPIKIASLSKLSTLDCKQYPALRPLDFLLSYYDSNIGTYRYILGIFWLCIPIGSKEMKSLSVNITSSGESVRVWLGPVTSSSTWCKWVMISDGHISLHSVNRIFLESPFQSLVNTFVGPELGPASLAGSGDITLHRCLICFLGSFWCLWP